VKSIHEPWDVDPDDAAATSGSNGDGYDPAAYDALVKPDVATLLAAKSLDVALAECLATFHHWLELPDGDVVLVALGAVAANLTAGDPLWLLIVGPPGSGKTETIAPLVELGYVHAAATLTEAGLLSGVPKREHAKDAKGGLLRTVGAFGIILAKDFTSVLTMNRDARAAVMSALREVYDGSWTRHLGSDGGRTLSWDGKCGVIGAVTPTIDKHHAVMGALGERFTFYRLHVADPRAQARQRMRNRGQERRMRAELAAAALAVLDRVALDGAPRRLDDAEIDDMVNLATFVVTARTAVERDQYTRDVDVMPEPEAPGRLVAALGAIHAGIEAIGAPNDTAWRIVTKVAWDCIPATRCAVLLALGRDAPCKVGTILERTGMPRTTADRQLEDLELLGLISKDREHDKAPWVYDLTPAAVDLWPSKVPPERSSLSLSYSTATRKEEHSGGTP
jgi:DNA-binding MarR family transcriptional regulator